MVNRSLRRSLSDFSRHPWLHLISISTISVALIILGGFFLCFRNFEALAEKTSPQITGTAYLKDALSEAQVQSLEERILSLENVRAVRFKNKKSVVDDLKGFLGVQGSEVLPGSELFPDVLEVELRPQSSSADSLHLKTAIAQFPEVAEVDFSEDWLAQYKKVRQLISFIGAGLLLGILGGCSFIIANFMGMRHQSRKEEIEIVQLIGASHRFVLTPFLWEGVIEGLIGASIALLLLYVGKVSLSTVVNVQWNSLLGIREWLYLSPLQFAGILSTGMGMALCGSFVVFLRFQKQRAR